MILNIIQYGAFVRHEIFLCPKGAFHVEIIGAKNYGGSILPWTIWMSISSYWFICGVVKFCELLLCAPFLENSYAISAYIPHVNSQLRPQQSTTPLKLLSQKTIRDEAFIYAFLSQIASPLPTINTRYNSCKSVLLYMATQNERPNKLKDIKFF